MRNKIRTWITGVRGYVLLGICLGILYFVIPSSEIQPGILKFLFSLFIFGPMMAGVVYGVRKYGLLGFIERIVAMTIRILVIFTRPVGFLAAAIYTFFLVLQRVVYEKIPSYLPPVVRPSYKFFVNIVAIISIFLLFIWLDMEEEEENMLRVSYLGLEYKITKDSVMIAGLLLFYAIADIFLSYGGMLWNFAGNVGWKIKVQVVR